MIGPANRRLLAITVLLVPISIALMRVHTLFTLLTIPFCFGAPLGVAMLASPLLCGKPFVPVSRSDTAEETRQQGWTDYVLTGASILCGVGLLFVFGEVADCIRNENVWKADLLPVTIDICKLLHLRNGG